MEPKDVSTRVRRATYDDLGAIIDINDNVYDGFDYLPALFYTFMQSSQHKLYVCELDRKLIAFVNIYLFSDRKDVATSMSGRVRSDFQGHGLMVGNDPNTSIFRYVIEDHPNLTGILGATLVKPHAKDKVDQWDHLHRWNSYSYRISDPQQIASILRSSRITTGRRNPVSLSYVNANDWLNRNDDLVKFLSRYSTQFVPAEFTWKPIPVNKGGLRHIFSSSNALVSFTSPGVEDVRPSTVVENEIAGLSYSHCLPCRYGQNVMMFFYGDGEDDLISHVYGHLRHYIKLANGDVGIGCHVCFPLTINSNNVEERLKNTLGDRVTSGHWRGGHEAVLFLATLPINLPLNLPSKI